jgi:hypothetical protein
MASRQIKASHFSRDTLEFLESLYKYNVDYVIVGGQAVIYYGHVRLTGDVDIFYNRDKQNIEKLYKALEDFWSGAIPGLSDQNDLDREGIIVQFGIPPNRIDLINIIEAVSFADAEKSKEIVEIRMGSKTIKIYYINLDLLIRNKEALSRPRDLEDLKFLKAVKNIDSGQ